MKRSAAKGSYSAGCDLDIWNASSLKKSDYDRFYLFHGMKYDEKRRRRLLVDLAVREIWSGVILLSVDFTSCC